MNFRLYSIKGSRYKVEHSIYTVLYEVKRVSMWKMQNEKKPWFRSVPFYIGPLATMVWHILRLEMEERVCRYCGLYGPWAWGGASLVHDGDQ
jgi:hypothetical protein